MKKLCLLIVLICSSAMAQEAIPYKIYTSKGRAIPFKRMLKQLRKVDVVLFGEYHNNSLGHWLQLKTAQELVNENLILGAEMFEADNQFGVNKYVEGVIDEKELEEEVRLWSNFKTDYKPLLDLAKAHRFSFVATNVPRRLANKLYKEGGAAIENLDEQEKQWMPPLPFPYDSDLPGYKAMLFMFDDDHVNENLPKAQALKDATMAYNIGKNRKENQLFLHFNGSYHSNNYEGIVWYLNQYYPGTNILTLTMVEQDNVQKIEEESKNLADFIIVIDRDIHKTF